MDTATRYRAPVDHVGLYPDPTARTNSGQWKLVVKQGCMATHLTIPAAQHDADGAFARAVAELSTMGLRVFP